MCVVSSDAGNNELRRQMYAVRNTFFVTDSVIFQSPVFPGNLHAYLNVVGMHALFN